jgi:hypothetical protein
MNIKTLKILKYLFDNGLTNLLQYNNFFNLDESFYYDRDTKNYYTIEKIINWSHTSPKPGESDLNFSLKQLEEIEGLYNLSLKAIQGKFIICNTHTADYLKSIAKEGTLQWCLSDKIMKIKKDGEFIPIEKSNNIDIPISNERW